MADTSRDLVEATQADRDAAGDFIHGGRSAMSVYEADYIAHIRAGRKDSDKTVQAFARHRLAALSAIRAHMLSEVVVERAAAAFDAAAWNEDARTGTDAVKPAIRAALSAAVDGIGVEG